MTKMLPLPLLLVVACSDDPSTEGTPTDEPTSGELVASQARTTSGASMEEAVAVTTALSLAFRYDEVGDYAEDGELSATGSAGAAFCASVSVDGSDLTLDFDGCTDVSGTLIVSVPRFGPTTLTFEDDFAIHGEDLDGTLEFDAIFLDRRFTLTGDLTKAGTTLEVELDVTALGGLELFGSVVVDDGVNRVEVVTGTEAEPLTWAPGCRCAASGAVEASVSGAVDAIVVDFDTFVRPLDGDDGFPPFEVAAEASFSAEAMLDFVAACEPTQVSVSAEDVTTVVVVADLEAALDEACDAGEVDAGDCDDAQRVLDNLADEVTIVVPTAELAASLEAELQASIDDACPAL